VIFTDGVAPDETVPIERTFDGPAAPTFPRGIVKLNTAAPLVPELETEALVPALPVVVVPTAMVAAFPVSPLGRTRFNAWLGEDPVMVADAEAPPVTVPIVRTFGGPVGPWFISTTVGPKVTVERLMI
jgi:hypothetical protein